MMTSIKYIALTALIGIVSSASYADGVDQTLSLEQAVKAPYRASKRVARDKYRHPLETLRFLKVTPSSTVVELWPGGGWYTDIIAPYLRQSGKYTAAGFHLSRKPLFRGRIQRNYLASLAARPDLFDQIQHVTFSPPDITRLGPDNSADVVLTFRNSHNWQQAELMPAVYAAAFAVLKPGGVFGVVQHRAQPGANPKRSAFGGYLPQAYVIKQAKKAGFLLDASSEINANGRDVKSYPEGVWTLPPSLRLKNKDREKYLAIGESDRMTLRFVKPK